MRAEKQKNIDSCDQLFERIVIEILLNSNPPSVKGTLQVEHPWNLEIVFLCSTKQKKDYKSRYEIINTQIRNSRLNQTKSSKRRVYFPIQEKYQTKKFY